MNGFLPIGRIVEVQPDVSYREFVVYAPPVHERELKLLINRNRKRIWKALTERTNREHRRTGTAASG